MEKVLIVEDNDLQAFTLKTLFEEQTSFEAHVTDNGSDALLMCTKETYKILLVDINLPIMSGKSFIEDLREQGGPNQKTPVIVVSTEFLSGKSEGEDEIYFLPKPVKKGELIEKISKVLGEKAV